MVMFPPGLFSPDEKAAVLNDAGIHFECLNSLEFAPDAIARLEEYVGTARGE